MSNNKTRLIAFYLPQFYPTPENDIWWRKGFTEWTNVGNAKPLFKGHYQPRVPADLGYYDLRVPEVREQQAELAREAGIEGFCYWHYWFAGRRLLDRVFTEVVESGHPDYPFCLCWANHSWYQKTWDPSSPDKLLIEQTYPGEKDYIDQFNAMLPAFKDKRYIRVDDKPVFFIYESDKFPEVASFIKLWRTLAKENGLNDFHFVAMLHTGSLRSNATVKERIDRVMKQGFDAVNTVGYTKAEKRAGRLKKYIHAFLSKLGINTIIKFKQADINKYILSDEDELEYVYPTVMPNWDRSPRGGKASTIYTNSTPQVFEKILKVAIEKVKNKEPEHRIVIIRSWNEWGEGNYMEPDLKYGHGYLNAIKDALSNE